MDNLKQYYISYTLTEGRWISDKIKELALFETENKDLMQVNAIYYISEISLRLKIKESLVNKTKGHHVGILSRFENKMIPITEEEKNVFMEISFKDLRSLDENAFLKKFGLEVWAI